MFNLCNKMEVGNRPKSFIIKVKNHIVKKLAKQMSMHKCKRDNRNSRLIPSEFLLWTTFLVWSIQMQVKMIWKWTPLHPCLPLLEILQTTFFRQMLVEIILEDLLPGQKVIILEILDLLETVSAKDLVDLV